MTIRIEITGEDPAQIAQNIVSMAFLFAPHLRAVNAPAQTPVVEVETVADNAGEARKPRGRAKKTDVVIDHQAEEVKQDVHGDTGSGGAVAGAGEGGEAAGGSTAGDAPADAAVGEADQPSDDSPAEVDAVADDKPGMSIDELRKFTVEQYLVPGFATQPERKDAFGKLLGLFGVTAIGELPAEKINAWKATVDKLIAGLKKEEAA